MSEIRIVLVEPSHPGNIGAVARAMCNMALESLVLVRPRQFPHPEATARASGADSVLARARVVGTVAEAIAGCGFIAATTARDRDQNFRVLEARAAAARILEAAASQPAAILFGAERTGLVNEDLEPAHVLVRIPADQAYASLNLAMAVQIVAYEIYMQKLALEAHRAGAPGQPEGAPEGLPGVVPLATPEAMERLYAHLGEVMEAVGFRDRTQSGTHLMARIRRFLQRAELDCNEANIVRGLLTAIQGRRRPAGSKVPR
ncbi:MAG: RNA methyltransferase [Steroidobacteraceae bacterium]